MLHFGESCFKKLLWHSGYYSFGFYMMESACNQLFGMSTHTLQGHEYLLCIWRDFPPALPCCVSTRRYWTGSLLCISVTLLVIWCSVFSFPFSPHVSHREQKYRKNTVRLLFCLCLWVCFLFKKRWIGHFLHSALDTLVMPFLLNMWLCSFLRSSYNLSFYSYFVCREHVANQMQFTIQSAWK